MKVMTSTISAFLFASVLSSAAYGATGLATVRTGSGDVIGTLVPRSDRTIASFKGIPYAAAPIGTNRWRDPQPVAAWATPRPATNFGKACIQPPAPFDVLEVGEQSEDCLFLNVWAPASSIRRPPLSGLPIMVFIHGGSYATGSGGIYSGEYLAAKNAVVVTFNYRLGAFGFLAHSALSAEAERQTSGNYAMLDMVAALRWVQTNGAAFGGDINNVTIFGQSAGGDAVTRLMTMPMAQGLFHRVIAESGSPSDADYDLAETEKDGAKFAEQLHCETAAKPVDCMRAATPAAVMAASDRAEIGFGAITDGAVVPEVPGKVFDRGEQAHVPLLVGLNKDEGAMFVRSAVILTVNQYKRTLNNFFGDEYGPQVFDAYPISFGLQGKAALAKVVDAAVYTSPARQALRRTTVTDVPTYQYHFTKSSAYSDDMGMGVFHGLELFYLFGWNQREEGFTAADLTLADQMRSYWVNFAATGNPNQGPAARSNLPNWPAFVAGTEPYLELGATITAKKNLCTVKAAHCDLFDEWAHSEPTDEHQARSTKAITQGE